jgi:hypothetical protein
MMIIRKKSGNKGRGRRAVSAQRPKIAIIPTVRKAVGIFKSWDFEMDVNPRFETTVG